jgi:hypothetical protein
VLCRFEYGEVVEMASMNEICYVLHCSWMSQMRFCKLVRILL